MVMPFRLIKSVFCLHEKSGKVMLHHTELYHYTCYRVSSNTCLRKDTTKDYVTKMKQYWIFCSKNVGVKHGNATIVLPMTGQLILRFQIISTEMSDILAKLTSSLGGVSSSSSESSSSIPLLFASSSFCQ